MKPAIYLDNHATTPLDPRVLEAMLPWFTERYGNASSKSHRFGWEAEEAVETARAQVARLVGVSAKEVVFTSGATESDNLALRGALPALAARGRHVITCAIEHRAVLDTVRDLERHGLAEATVVPVGGSGLVDPDDVRGALRPGTVLVSVMAANNEVGTLQPVAEIARIAREAGALFHTDAAQAVARVPLDLRALGADLASLSAHKMYGPKGVGALVVRKGEPRVKLAPLFTGGGQERGLRPGTLPVPLIVGFGAAAAIAAAELETEAARLGALRRRLHEGLAAALPHLAVNGDLDRRLPGNLNVSFLYVDGEALITGLRDVAVSAGSACTSAGMEPSHVLRALGVKDEQAHTAIRFGLGRFTTEADVDRTIELVVRHVRRLRAMSPLYELVERGADPRAEGWDPGP